MFNYNANGRNRNTSSSNPQLKLVVEQPRGEPSMLLDPPTQRCADLDEKNCLIIFEANQSPQGASRKQLMSVADIARTSLVQRVQKLITPPQDFLIQYSPPTSSPNVKPTYFYRLSAGVAEEELRYIAQIALAQQAQPSEPIESIAKKKRKSVEELKRGDLDSVSSAVAEIKPAFRRDYLEVLAYLFRFQQATIRQLSDATGQPKPTIHSRLTKWMRTGLVDREKRKTEDGYEYLYFLATDVNATELISIFRKYLANSDLALIPENDSNQVEAQTMVASSSSKSADEVPLKSQQISLLGKLVEKLPEFDSSWSDELKEKWFNSYERLMSLGDIQHKDS
ncbi:MarR family transcriptional regulator [Leptolyngbya sp. AN10]|uniref:MarR family transcriptional regulator n=1 Tax=Leptolyngbya sp. AN10 TaxID=3423365 RepID=UPI003D30FFB1